MLKIMNVRKKPIIIQAVLITPDNMEELAVAFKDFDIQGLRSAQTGKQLTVSVKTLEGVTKAQPGAYLMIGVIGELYICDGSVFNKTYDVVEV